MEFKIFCPVEEQREHLVFKEKSVVELLNG